MVVVRHVKGYEKYIKFMQEFNPGEQKAFIYFTGNKDPTGYSWCPDCTKAWPVVTKVMESLPKDSHLVVVEVGEREEWKDSQNPFRKDKLKLMVIPTLTIWNGTKKLEGEMCGKIGMVSMMIEDFDDDDD